MSRKYTGSVQPFIEDAKLRYKMELARILEKQDDIIRLNVLKDRAIKHFTGCQVTAGGHTSYPSLTVVLTKGFNITRHTMQFLDDNEGLINVLGRGDKFTTKMDSAANSYDFKWPNLFIYVYFDGGDCKRILKGVETVEKPIYEIECY